MSEVDSNFPDFPKVNTVKELINYQAETRPNQHFIAFPQSESLDENTTSHLTYSEIKEQSQRITDFFCKSGLKQGDIILIAISNGRSAIELFTANLLGGFTTLFLNLVGKSQWEYIIGHCKPKVIICEPAHYDTLKVIAEKNNISTIIKQEPQETFAFPSFSQNDKEGQNQDSSSQNLPNITADDPAILMYTSGTTGNPKGALLSHLNVLTGGKNTAIAHDLKEDDVGLCVLPLYHINAQMVSIMSTLICGAKVILPPSFSVSNFWNLIAHFKCSWFSVVPTQINYLIHRSSIQGLDISCVEFGRSASAPLSPEVHKNFENKFGINIVETMGLTETAAQILSNPRDPKKQKYGTPGLAVGNEVKVFGDGLKELPPDQIGEIVVKGDNVMLEYLNDPENTSKTIIDGWLFTGDLGYMDEDGFVFVTGRKKEIIIKGGENISPREIDDVLYLCPEVIEAATFGVDCESYGQDSEVAVVIKPGKEISEATLLSLCEEKLGSFKKPRKVHFLNELPKGPSGKIQRNKIPELLKGIS